MLKKNLDNNELILLFIPVVFLTILLYRYGVLFVDDAYYYLQIAFHLSKGDGFTFDGIHLTNGFHPMWQLVLVPLFWISQDKSIIPYITVGLQIFLYMSSGIFLSRILYLLTQQKFISFMGMFLWLFNVWFLFKGAVTGMETGLLLFLLGFYFWALTKYSRGEISGYAPGILLLLVIATRLDMVFLALSSFVVINLFDRSLKQNLILFLPSIIYLSVYFSINYYTFGFITPISGKIKTLFGQQLLYDFFSKSDMEIFRHFFENMTRLFTLGRIPLLVSFGVAFLALSGFYFIYDSLQKQGKLITFSYFLYTILLLGFYSFMYRNVLTVYKYYWMPVFYGAIIMLGLFVSLQNKKSKVISVAMLSIMTLIFSGLYLKSLNTVAIYHVNKRYSPFYESVCYVNEKLPDDAVIGSWDAGQFGYLTQKPVVNLDGLVNNQELYHYIQQDKVDDYIRKSGITHLVNKNIFSRTKNWIDERLGWTPIFINEIDISDYRQTTIFTVNPNSLQNAHFKKDGYVIYAKPSSLETN